MDLYRCSSVIGHITQLQTGTKMAVGKHLNSRICRRQLPQLWENPSTIPLCGNDVIISEKMDPTGGTGYRKLRLGCHSFTNVSIATVGMRSKKSEPGYCFKVEMRDTCTYLYFRYAVSYTYFVAPPNSSNTRYPFQRFPEIIFFESWNPSPRSQYSV